MSVHHGSPPSNAAQHLNPLSVARALGGEASGNSILCPGPGHSKDDRSLSVTINSHAQDGFVVHSFAGDDAIACRDHVRAKLGMPPWQPNGTSAPPQSTIVATYNYEDELGNLLFQAVRRFPKKFSQRQPDGRGGWLPNLQGVRLVPYRLPEVIEAAAMGRRVFIVEGEKDADNLRKLGVVATCNPMGAGKWRDTYSEHFRGAEVIILPDNDAPGMDHARRVARSLNNIAASVRVAQLPGLPDKGDVSDWLAGGGDLARLEEVLARPTSPTPQAKQGEADLDAMAQEMAKAIVLTPYKPKPASSIPLRDWMYGTHLIRGFVSARFAPGATGKTSLALVEALAMVTGKPLLGIAPKCPLNVFVWNGEDPLEEVERRFEAVRLHYGIGEHEMYGKLFLMSGRDVEIKTAIMTAGGRGLRILEPVIAAITAQFKAHAIDAAIIDPFVSSHSVNENDNTQIDAVVKKWGKVARDANCAIDLVHHMRKSPTGAVKSIEDGRGASALKDAARDAQLLLKMTPDEASQALIDEDEAWRYFRIADGKANMAPPAGSKTSWYRLASVNLGNGPDGGPGDSVGVVTTYKPNGPFEGVAGVAVERMFAGMRGNTSWRYSSQSKEGWFGDYVAACLDLDTEGGEGKLNRKRINQMIAAWLKSGAIKKVMAEDEKRNERPMIVLGNWFDP